MRSERQEAKDRCRRRSGPGGRNGCPFSRRTCPPRTVAGNAERGMTMATASGLHRGDRRARGEILVNNQGHRPAREARDKARRRGGTKARRHSGAQVLRCSGTQALRHEGPATRAMRAMAAAHRRPRAVSGNKWYCVAENCHSQFTKGRSHSSTVCLR